MGVLWKELGVKMPDEVTHMDRRNTPWTVSKEIPISTISTIVLQTIALIFFLAKMDNRITLLEERRQDDKAAIAVISQLKDRMVQTEFQAQALQKSLERLELKMDQQRAIAESVRQK